MSYFTVEKIMPEIFTCPCSRIWLCLLLSLELDAQPCCPGAAACISIPLFARQGRSPAHFAKRLGSLEKSPEKSVAGCGSNAVPHLLVVLPLRPLPSGTEAKQRKIIEAFGQKRDGEGKAGAWFPHALLISDTRLISLQHVPLIHTASHEKRLPWKKVFTVTIAY